MKFNPPDKKNYRYITVSIDQNCGSCLLALKKAEFDSIIDQNHLGL